MKVLISTLLVIATTTFSLIANASVDGNFLLSQCIVAKNAQGGTNTASNPQDAYSIGYCNAWVSSALDELMYDPTDVHRACIPTVSYTSPSADGKGVTIAYQFEVTDAQIIRVLAKFLKEHPERLHENAMLLTYEAFRDAFPCE